MCADVGLGLHLGFRASAKSEPMVKLQGFYITERAQWALEKFGGCGVHLSIWKHPHGDKLRGSESCGLLQSNRQFLWRNSEGLM